MVEERDFRRGELLGKFTKNGSQFLQRRNLEGRIMSRS